MTKELKINELRIGNLVNYEQTTHVVVRLLADRGPVGFIRTYWLNDDGDKLFPYYAPTSHHSGIEITEEWLEKLGFEKVIKNLGPPIHDDIEHWDLDGYCFSKDVFGNWYLCGYNWNIERFRYMHQLQNIFFVLSGEELDIKK